MGVWRRGGGGVGGGMDDRGNVRTDWRIYLGLFKSCFVVFQATYSAKKELSQQSALFVVSDK